VCFTYIYNTVLVDIISYSLRETPLNSTHTWITKEWVYRNIHWSKHCNSYIKVELKTLLGILCLTQQNPKNIFFFQANILAKTLFKVIKTEKEQVLKC